MSKPTYVASQLKATVLGLLLCVIIFPVACNSKGPTSETPVAGGAAPAVQVPHLLPELLNLRICLMEFLPVPESWN
jgi:hypothetical protein